MIHYALMTMVSITTVGAILVVAFMIVPAATAYLMTDDLKRMIVIAVAVGAVSAIAGFFIAFALDASVAGAMATMAGAFFLLALLFSPLYGLVVKATRLRRQRVQFATEMLVVHLLNHASQVGEEHESEVTHLSSELRWTPNFAQTVMRSAIQAGLIKRTNSHLALTEQGMTRAQTLAAQA